LVNLDEGRKRGKKLRSASPSENLRTGKSGWKSAKKLTISKASWRLAGAIWNVEEKRKLSEKLIH